MCEEDIEYIKNVFKLDGMTAADVMTPRTSVVHIATDVTDEEIMQFGTGALRKAVKEGDWENGSFLCGQIAGLVKKEQTCQEILEEIVAETEAILKGAASRLV